MQRRASADAFAGANRFSHFAADIRQKTCHGHRRRRKRRCKRTRAQVQTHFGHHRAALGGPATRDLPLKSVSQVENLLSPSLRRDVPDLKVDADDITDRPPEEIEAAWLLQAEQFLRTHYEADEATKLVRPKASP